jgi:aryl-alcohol dehydrogenase-like predicted oxidoreductase
MIRRRLGPDGPHLNAIGLGCMGISFAYGPSMEENDAIALLHAAIDRGVDHFDTAELYGAGHNERLLGAAFHDRRDSVFIATKFGPVLDPETGMSSGRVDGSEQNARRALEQSLRHLRTDHVDLWYLHRRDRSRPIEEIVGVMARMVEEGKVEAIGLSEVTADTLRKAATVHPVAAVQSEYSIFTRFVEDEVLSACEELGTTLVAYSPLGRGMLTGSFSRDWKPEGWDFRAAAAPRFRGEAMDNNLALVAEIERVAEDAGCTPAQVALAWVLARSESVVTIPGTTKVENLDGNLAAAAVQLDGDQTARLDALAESVKGDRYSEAGMAAVDG